MKQVMDNETGHGLFLLFSCPLQLFLLFPCLDITEVLNLYFEKNIYIIYKYEKRTSIQEIFAVVAPANWLNTVPMIYNSLQIN